MPLRLSNKKIKHKNAYCKKVQIYKKMYTI